MQALLCRFAPTLLPQKPSAEIGLPKGPLRHPQSRDRRSRKPYRKKHRERLAAYFRAYQRRNRTQLLEYRRKYRERNQLEQLHEIIRISEHQYPVGHSGYAQAMISKDENLQWLSKAQAPYRILSNVALGLLAPITGLVLLYDQFLR